MVEQNYIFHVMDHALCVTDHRDYKRIEAASRYKFSQARASSRVKLKFANGGQIQVPDAEPGCKVVHLLVVE